MRFSTSILNASLVALVVTAQTGATVVADGSPNAVTARAADTPEVIPSIVQDQIISGFEKSVGAAVELVAKAVDTGLTAVPNVTKEQRANAVEDVRACANGYAVNFIVDFKKILAALFP